MTWFDYKSRTVDPANKPRRPNIRHVCMNANIDYAYQAAGREGRAARQETRRGQQDANQKKAPGKLNSKHKRLKRVLSTAATATVMEEASTFKAAAVKRSQGVCNPRSVTFEKDAAVATKRQGKPARPNSERATQPKGYVTCSCYSCPLIFDDNQS